MRASVRERGGAARGKRVQRAAQPGEGLHRLPVLPSLLLLLLCCEVLEHNFISLVVSARALLDALLLDLGQSASRRVLHALNTRDTSRDESGNRQRAAM